MTKIFADINGDGKYDLLMFTSGSVSVSYSQGREKMTKSEYIAYNSFGTFSGYPSADSTPRYFGKFNNDRFIDIIAFG